MEMMRDLGAWQKHRLKKGVKEQGEAMQNHLDNSPISVTELRKQWEEQREAQLSIRAREYLLLI